MIPPKYIKVFKKEIPNLVWLTGKDYQDSNLDFTKSSTFWALRGRNEDEQRTATSTISEKVRPCACLIIKPIVACDRLLYSRKRTHYISLFLFGF